MSADADMNILSQKMRQVEGHLNYSEGVEDVEASLTETALQNIVAGMNRSERRKYKSILRKLQKEEARNTR